VPFSRRKRYWVATQLSRRLNETSELVNTGYRTPVGRIWFVRLTRRGVIAGRISRPTSTASAPPVPPPDKDGVTPDIPETPEEAPDSPQATEEAANLPEATEVPPPPPEGTEVAAPPPPSPPPLSTAAPALTGKAIEASAARDKSSQDKGEGTFARLQGRSQDQLAFVNNLLTTLALAVLAFAGGSALDKSTRSELGWRRYLLGSALILLAVSLVIGISLALNRLQSFRISARTARIRELRGPLKSTRSYELQNLGDQAVFLQQWSRFGKISRDAEPKHKGIISGRRAERRSVSNCASGLSDATKRARDAYTGAPGNKIQPTPNGDQRTGSADGAGNTKIEDSLDSRRGDDTGKDASPSDGRSSELSAQDEEIKKQEKAEEEVRTAALALLNALRRWSKSADKTTWDLLYGQALTFLAAAILLLLVPLSYYFS
jgi:hypothetical protein